MRNMFNPILGGCEIVCFFIKFPFVEYKPGEITPSYIMRTRAFGTYLLGGLITLQKRL
jgi:hypothetical protein